MLLSFLVLNNEVPPPADAVGVRGEGGRRAPTACRWGYFMWRSIRWGPGNPAKNAEPNLKAPYSIFELLSIAVDRTVSLLR